MSEPAVKFSFQNAAAFPQLPSRSVMIRWMTRACELPTMMTVRFVDLEVRRLLEVEQSGDDVGRHDLDLGVVLLHHIVIEVTADVAICVPVVEREAAEQNKEFRAHLAHLLIHAVLHAHGYDHVTQEEAEVMEARETELMLSLKFPNPYSDRIGMVHD